MLDLSEFIGLEYATPYDCFTFVKAVRKKMGLLTPVLYDPDISHSQDQIAEHAKSDYWFERPTLHTGLPGDVVLMSKSMMAPAHHIGVVVDQSSIIHLDFGRTSALLPLSRIYLAYPGHCSRWGTTLWESSLTA